MNTQTIELENLSNWLEFRTNKFLNHMFSEEGLDNILNTTNNVIIYSELREGEEFTRYTTSPSLGGDFETALLQEGTGVHLYHSNRVFSVTDNDIDSLFTWLENYFTESSIKFFGRPSGSNNCYTIRGIDPYLSDRINIRVDGGIGEIHAIIDLNTINMNNNEVAYDVITKITELLGLE